VAQNNATEQAAKQLLLLRLIIALYAPGVKMHKIGKIACGMLVIFTCDLVQSLEL
jgi:hypothetical protein